MHEIPKSENPQKWKSTVFPSNISNFSPKTRLPRSPNRAASFGRVGAISETFLFCPTFVRPSKNQKNDAETATCYRSLQENSPWDHAQIKERPTWRSIARSRALYDQMAPQLCLFYISAKFDFCPTAPMSLKLCPSCRPRKKLQNCGIETSVRPNPTLVFFSFYGSFLFASEIMPIL